MNILHKFVFHFYIILWMMYYLQNLLMIKGAIAQIILVIVLAISLYAFFAINLNYRTVPFLKWLNIMFLVTTIYGIIPIIGGWSLEGFWQHETTSTHIYLQRTYQSILPIYAFYYFTLKGQITEKAITYLFFAFLIYSFLMYYSNYMVHFEKSGKEEITNNMGYSFVPLIPMLFLVKMRDLWKYLLVIVIMAYLMMAMKRGAILIGVVMLVLFMCYHFKNISWKRSFYISLLSVIVVTAAYKFTLDLYDSSSYFRHRIEQTKEGRTSHRDEIYTSYFEYFTDRTSPMEFIIGNGANATIALLGHYAHNDWLEFAINHGIIGVIMYLIYWIMFVGEWKNYRGPTMCRWALGALIIGYFMKGLYSMSFDAMPIAATISIGYCLATGLTYRTFEAFNEEVLE